MRSVSLGSASRKPGCRLGSPGLAPAIGAEWPGPASYGARGGARQARCPLADAQKACGVVVCLAKTNRPSETRKRT